MSILNPGTPGNGAAGPNPWAGRCTALAVVAPWWQTTATVGVVEVAVTGAAGANLLSFVVHVNRSTKSGRTYAAAPAAKRDETWVPAYSILDKALEEAVHACAVSAYERGRLEGVAPAPSTPTAAEGLPF